MPARDARVRPPASQTREKPKSWRSVIIFSLILRER